MAMGAANAHNTSKGNEVSIILKNDRTRQTAKCTEKVDNLQVAIMDQFWDNGRGDFKDSPFNPTLYLQYANSMTIVFLVISPKHRVYSWAVSHQPGGKEWELTPVTFTHLLTA